MSTEQPQEIWQVDANGKIFETNFAEMTTWIDEGALLRQDKVRKGNLRWIEAGKVPSLMAVFNAKENGQPLPAPVITTTKLGPTTMPGSAGANPTNLSQAPSATVSSPPDIVIPADPVCNMHDDLPAAYICETCFNNFCKACPTSYGGTVKICPFCGAMCKSIAEARQKHIETVTYTSAVSGGFGFGDFTEALAYPFRFKFSLVIGAIMFMLFSVGQSAVSFGGIFMLVGAIFCFMLTNMLTFGVLANTVENFSQGKIGLNFMPSFDDFSIWDDVIHPFFLSIGVYISSFGPFMLLTLVTVFMLIGAVGKEMNGLQSDAARTVNPELPYAANAVKQSETVKDLLSKQQDDQKKRIAAIEKGEEPPADIRPAGAVRDTSEENVARANEMIQQQRKAQMEAMIGKTPETRAKENQALFSKVMGYGPLFLILGGICLLWAFFYFPAACAVAGYTQSFGATLNPAVGIDTIRRLGGDYFKILIMGFVIVVISGFIGGVLNVIFVQFDLPGMGNIPARAIGSLFGFYFSVVFSCVIGFALYKASDRLKLYR